MKTFPQSNLWKMIILILCLLFILSACESKRKLTYQDLEYRIEELESENEALLEALSDCGDDWATIWCYFNEEDDVSFKEASKAFDRIDENLSNYILP